jgi:hypothetical protein
LSRFTSLVGDLHRSLSSENDIPNDVDECAELLALPKLKKLSSSEELLSESSSSISYADALSDAKVFIVPKDFRCMERGDGAKETSSSRISVLGCSFVASVR